MGGNGFIAARKWSPQIISYHFLFPTPHLRLLLKLDYNKTPMVVQVFASITASDDDEVKEFYDDLESTLIVKFTYMVVMVTRRFGTCVWNDRGDRVTIVAETNKLFFGNTWLRKKAGRRWS